MLKGDLDDVGLPQVLGDLAGTGATGCLHVQDPVGEKARVHLRSGRVYAVSVADRRPELGPRLVTSGALAPEALAEALEAQRTELQGWRLGELLVHLGYVEQPVVEAYVQEQVRESLSELLLWQQGTWRFRTGERTREDVAPPTDVADLLTDVASRREVWDAITRVVPGAHALPLLSAAGAPTDELSIDGDAWSLLCKVDGTRTVGELARDAGLTLHEAVTVVHGLVVSGLLEIEVPGPVAASAPGGPLDVPDEVPYDLHRRADPDDVDGSISRVSAALTALLGPSSGVDDVFTAQQRPARTPDAAPVPDAEQERLAARRVEREARDAGRRERDAEELAAAQAALEASRAEQAAQVPALPEQHEAVVVDLEARREVAREQAQLDAHADLLAQLDLDGPTPAEPAEPTEPAELAEPTEPAGEQERTRAALAAELSAAYFTAPSTEPSTEPSTAPALDDAPAAPDLAPADAAPAGWGERDTDTAALMRELSSLGLEDQPVPAPRAPSAPRPVPPAPARKRKGLFGR